VVGAADNVLSVSVVTVLYTKMREFFPANGGRLTPRIYAGHWGRLDEKGSRTCHVSGCVDLEEHRHVDGGCWGFIDSAQHTLRRHIQGRRSSYYDFLIDQW
jgi:hypothetical protein